MIVFTALFVYVGFLAASLELGRRDRRRPNRRHADPLLSALQWDDKNQDGASGNGYFQRFLSDEKLSGGGRLDEALLKFTDHSSYIDDRVSYLRALLEAGAYPNVIAVSGLIVDPDFTIRGMRKIELGKARPEGTLVLHHSPLSISIGNKRRGVERTISLLDVLVQWGARVLDPTAILTTIINGDIKRFSWFSQHEEFPAFLLNAHPIFLISMAKLDRHCLVFFTLYEAFGGRLDVRFPDGSNLLMHASPKALKYLMADARMQRRVKDVGPNGNTPLHYCVDGRLGLEAAGLILKLTSVISPLQVNDDGNTPIMHAALCSSKIYLKCSGMVFKLLPHSYPTRNKAGQCLSDIARETFKFLPTFSTVMHVINAWSGAGQYAPFGVD